MTTDAKLLNPWHILAYFTRHAAVWFALCADNCTRMQHLIDEAKRG